MGEYFWIVDDYARVLELYVEAVERLAAHPIYGERCKTVTQLYSWIASLHILLGAIPEASQRAGLSPHERASSMAAGMYTAMYV